jgi:uncharacterized Zn finger protein (UPF0148 family)
MTPCPTCARPLRERDTTCPNCGPRRKSQPEPPREAEVDAEFTTIPAREWLRERGLEVPRVE